MSDNPFLTLSPDLIEYFTLRFLSLQDTANLRLVAKSMSTILQGLQPYTAMKQYPIEFCRFVIAYGNVAALFGPALKQHYNNVNWQLNDHLKKGITQKEARCTRSIDLTPAQKQLYSDIALGNLKNIESFLMNAKENELLATESNARLMFACQQNIPHSGYTEEVNPALWANTLQQKAVLETLYSWSQTLSNTENSLLWKIVCGKTDSILLHRNDITLQILQVAIQYNQIHVIKDIFSRHLDKVNTASYSMVIDKKTHTVSFLSLFYFSVLLGRSEIAKTLFDYASTKQGADFNIDPVLAFTMAMNAASLPLIHFFMDKNQDAIMDRINQGDLTSLSQSFLSEGGIGQKILSLVIDRLKPNTSLLYNLMMECIKKRFHPSFLELLIKKGAQPDNTLLKLAVQLGALPALSVLCHHLDVANVKNLFNIASNTKNIDSTKTLQLLMDHGMQLETFPEKKPSNSDVLFVGADTFDLSNYAALYNTSKNIYHRIATFLNSDSRPHEPSSYQNLSELMLFLSENDRDHSLSLEKIHAIYRAACQDSTLNPDIKSRKDSVLEHCKTQYQQNHMVSLCRLLASNTSIVFSDLPAFTRYIYHPEVQLYFEKLLTDLQERIEKILMPYEDKELIAKLDRGFFMKNNYPSSYVRYVGLCFLMQGKSFSQNLVKGVIKPQPTGSEKMTFLERMQAMKSPEMSKKVTKITEEIHECIQSYLNSHNWIIEKDDFNNNNNNSPK